LALVVHMFGGAWDVTGFRTSAGLTGQDRSLSGGRVNSSASPAAKWVTSTRATRANGPVRPRDTRFLFSAAGNCSVNDAPGHCAPPSWPGGPFCRWVHGTCFPSRGRGADSTLLGVPPNRLGRLRAYARGTGPAQHWQRAGRDARGPSSPMRLRAHLRGQGRRGWRSEGTDRSRRHRARTHLPLQTGGGIRRGV